jgi:hypothetical protein
LQAQGCGPGVPSSGRRLVRGPAGAGAAPVVRPGGADYGRCGESHAA